jgi:hypothetical protein
MQKNILILLLALLPLPAVSQQNIRDSSIAFTMIGASGAWQIPGGNLDERFGNNFNIGGVFQWKTKKNILLGLDGQFIFGNTVKENSILDSLITSQGGIISSQGEFADVILYERGFKFELKIGKIFPVFGPNKNSGILTTLGGGIVQHKIRIENQGSSVPSIEEDYKKGYDRLSNGFSLTAFAGYMNFGNNRLVNFYAGLELTQAFTQNRRSFNFDTREQDLKKRNDLFLGLRLGWVIPLYKRAPKEFYYN